MNKLRCLATLYCVFGLLNRFEYRESISYRCVACQGSGERAMYLEAIVEAFLEMARKNDDIGLAEAVNSKLNGYHQFESRRTIRALKDKKLDQEHKQY